MKKSEIKKIRFDKICDDWLAYKKPIIKESTYLNYAFTIKKRFEKDFENKTVDYFFHYDLNHYIELLQEKLSNKTIREHITILKSILKYAERKYDFDFKLDLVSLPKADSKQLEIFNDNEVKKIENYIINSKEFKNLGVLISLYAGLRIGEVCALRWRDIDFDKKLLNVTHTLQRVYVGYNNTKVVYTLPKTKHSIRKIPISKSLYTVLINYKKQFNPDSYILTGQSDHYLEPIAYRYTYKKILHDCLINYKNYHCLRHTFATRCIRVGMDVKSLSEILGHSNVSITLEIYVHSSFEIKKKFIDKL